jgi:hypothetical protein
MNIIICLSNREEFIILMYDNSLVHTLFMSSIIFLCSVQQSFDKLSCRVNGRGCTPHMLRCLLKEVNHIANLVEDRMNCDAALQGKIKGLHPLECEDEEPSQEDNEIVQSVDLSEEFAKESKPNSEYELDMEYESSPRNHYIEGRICTYVCNVDKTAISMVVFTAYRTMDHTQWLPDVFVQPIMFLKNVPQSPVYPYIDPILTPIVVNGMSSVIKFIRNHLIFAIMMRSYLRGEGILALLPPDLINLIYRYL